MTNVAVRNLILGSFRFGYEYNYVIFPFEVCYYKLVYSRPRFGLTIVLEMCCAKERTVTCLYFIVADFYYNILKT